MSEQLKVVDGQAYPLGFSRQENRSNFALFSSSAKTVYLALFSGKVLFKEVAMIRSRDIWHIAIDNLPENLTYAFRCDTKDYLVDPHAKSVKDNRTPAMLPLAFDWQNDQPPQIPLADLIIYEVHVRGMTRHESAKTKNPGTYLSFIEKIPFLQKLGINAVELMPIFDSDPTHSKNTNPKTNEHLPNYWGYNVSHFFAPRSWYAMHDPVSEFKMMVRELHKANIEVILDVVYNHTGEGKDRSFVLNFRGIDNDAYYMMDEHGQYRNYSGCDNTFNCNHPAAELLILDSLRYWVEEMHVDGFRFDLGSIMTRGTDGEPMDPSPLLAAIAKDPVLRKVKLISESWDAAGLYQVGAFPKWGPWSEWNDKYRDTVRRFIKGDHGMVGSFANVLTGSEMIYHASKTPLSSVNFITAHDGFTLRDLVSYQHKHNLDNGEHNRDGSDNNYSWNSGAEGATDHAEINALRERQMRNFFLALFMSQGIPMLLMVDVYGHTAHGNNNAYVQDNELSWFLWNEMEKDDKIVRFISKLIEFRKSHPQLRNSHFFHKNEIDWHSALPFKPDWSDDSRFIACTFKKEKPIYLAFNASNDPVTITMPPGNWKLLVNTEENWHFHGEGKELGSHITLTKHSAFLAIQIN